jgi:Protein of unknown function (DUF1116)
VWWYDVTDILNSPLAILNLGLAHFADAPAQKGAPVLSVDWRPPGRGDTRLARLVAELADDREGVGAKIREANEIALQRLISAGPVLVDLLPAREALRDLTPATILHAGPPITWDRMCGAMRGGIIGALLYERLAETPEEAEELAGNGKIEFAPCHSRGAVGPMAGILSPSMPVLVVENKQAGTRGFATMNEGWGRTLRFGAFDEQVIERLRWMERVLAPALREAIHRLGGVNVKNMTARALHMGDEAHNRDLAGTSLFFKEVAPTLAAADLPRADLIAVLDFLAHQEHFFLNVSMAACKSMLLAAHGIPYSTLVTAMARNGVDVGIQVSGLEDAWFTAPATVPHGLYFPGYSEADANPDLGDSAISETAGIGAFVMGAAPAIVQFVGGTPAEAQLYTERMYTITLGENPNYTLPALDFRGAPLGIDVRRVVERNTTPVINTGIAHREPGHGLVGAGVVSAPAGCFEAALRAMEHW